MYNLIAFIIHVLIRSNFDAKRRRHEHLSARRLSPNKIVLSGPFQGLRYAKYTAYGSVLLPKLLGTYEKELHPWISNVLKQRFRRIINIGCAEGYYAVGFAFKLPTSLIWAFDVNQKALQYCKLTIKANHASQRVRVQMMPKDSTLHQLFRKNTFIFCDCEGNEQQYINIQKFPELKGCSFIVEIHEKQYPDGVPRLTAMFKKTHTIRIVHSQKRQISDIPKEVRVRIRYITNTALEEYRTDGYTWMYASPKPTSHYRS